MLGLILAATESDQSMGWPEALMMLGFFVFIWAMCRD